MSRIASNLLLATPLALAFLGTWSTLAWQTPAVEVRQTRTASLPAVVAWSWDRNEDLSFLGHDTAVAVVVTSVELEGLFLRVRPRRGALTLPAVTPVLPVVHVDAFSRWDPELNASQEAGLAQVVVEAGRRSTVGAVQVDFEALPSQRDFYRRVLQRVRAELPQTYLSITALASWCMGDRWLQKAPVDEVVAMAFRMGAQAASYRDTITQLPAWPEQQCSSVGVATDEPAFRPPAHERLYLFSPQPWTEARWTQARARYGARTLSMNEANP